MKLVKQKHSMGCVIACLAMILDMDYDSVMQESRIDPEKGAKRWQMQEYLRTKNYRIEYKDYNQPQTWTDLHLCSCFYQEDLGLSHLVVVYNQTVYNPDPEVLLPTTFKNLLGIRFLAAVSRIEGL